MCMLHIHVRITLHLSVHAQGSLAVCSYVYMYYENLGLICNATTTPDGVYTYTYVYMEANVCTVHVQYCSDARYMHSHVKAHTII